MKTMNPQATRIFCRLLDQMGTETQLTFNTKNQPPLLMQQIGGLIATPFWQRTALQPWALHKPKRRYSLRTGNALYSA